jgi:hypothetical protein
MLPQAIKTPTPRQTSIGNQFPYFNPERNGVSLELYLPFPYGEEFNFLSLATRTQRATGRPAKIYATRTQEMHQQCSKIHTWCTRQYVRENNYLDHAMRHDYSSSGCISSTSTMLCATTILCILSHCLATQLDVGLHRLYLDYTVRHDYIASSHIGSTSTTWCTANTHLTTALTLP